MREPNLPLSEWFWILPTVGSGCPVSLVHILHHLSFCVLGERWCAPPIVIYVVMVDDSIYEGRFLVGNLRTIAQLGLGIIIRYLGLMT